MYRLKAFAVWTAAALAFASLSLAKIESIQVSSKGDLKPGQKVRERAFVAFEAFPADSQTNMRYISSKSPLHPRPAVMTLKTSITFSFAFLVRALEAT